MHGHVLENFVSAIIALNTVFYGQVSRARRSNITIALESHLRGRLISTKTADFCPLQRSASPQEEPPRLQRSFRLEWQRRPSSPARIASPWQRAGVIGRTQGEPTSGSRRSPPCLPQKSAPEWRHGIQSRDSPDREPRAA